jgi:hypothetical protein
VPNGIDQHQVKAGELLERMPTAPRRGRPISRKAQQSYVLKRLRKFVRGANDRKWLAEVYERGMQSADLQAFLAAAIVKVDDAYEERHRVSHLEGQLDELERLAGKVDDADVALQIRDTVGRVQKELDRLHVGIDAAHYGGTIAKLTLAAAKLLELDAIEQAEVPGRVVIDMSPRSDGSWDADELGHGDGLEVA